MKKLFVLLLLLIVPVSTGAEQAASDDFKISEYDRTMIELMAYKIGFESPFICTDYSQSRARDSVKELAHKYLTELFVRAYSLGRDSFKDQFVIQFHKKELPENWIDGDVVY